ncbi:MAG: DUF6384 family protein [Maricaulaceae bacterium]
MSDIGDNFAPDAARVTASIDADIVRAMDVADTLRRSNAFALKDMKDGNSRADIPAQLRHIYAAQGLELSDENMAQGINALSSDRFAYAPPRAGLGLWLAKIYTSRKKWLPVLYTLIFLSGAVAAVNYYGFVLPAEVEAQRQEQMAIDAEKQRVQRELDAKREAIEAEERAKAIEADRQYQLKKILPPKFEALKKDALNIAKTTELKARAEELYQNGLVALQDEKLEDARKHLDVLNRYLSDLRRTYNIRIVSRPGEYSGVFRVNNGVFPVNKNGDVAVRNYYLIVEGVNASGQTVYVQITSEEDQKTKHVYIWGVRVPEAVFNGVAADKRDDQIIQNAIIGRKKSGYLKPDYSIDASGGFILDW